jgi:TonB family protein
MKKNILLYWRSVSIAMCIAGYLIAITVLSIAQSSDELKASVSVKEAFAPQYPRVALAAQVQGTVRIRVQVAQDGRVQQAEAVSGSPMLVPLVLEAAKKWKFAGSGKQAVGLDFRFEALASDAPKDEIGAVFMPPFAVLVRDRVPVIPDSPNAGAEPRQWGEGNQGERRSGTRR